MNNELGMPLAILGDYAEEYYQKGGVPSFWFKVILKSWFGLLSKKNYPEILVLEYGADHPGDIARLVKNFKPDVAVVTAIGEIPVHVEYFSGPEELAKEKSKLVEALEPVDFAVLNYDDPAVWAMKEKTKARVKSFGFGAEAEVKISDFNFKVRANNVPEGVAFKLHHGEDFT